MRLKVPPAYMGVSNVANCRVHARFVSVSSRPNVQALGERPLG